MLLAVGLLVAACGSATTSPTPVTRGRPHRPPRPRPRRPLGQRRQARPPAPCRRHLRPGRATGHRDPRAQAAKPVARQFIDETELRTIITEQFDQDTPPAYLAAQERLYKALGLIPADASLRDLSLDLLSGGVAGFYRDDEGKLYVVSKSGGPGPNERFYFAHEYDHALQDQNLTIFKDQNGILDQSDRLLARQAVYEGDATLLMTQWAAANLTQAELLELLSCQPPTRRRRPSLTRTPAILRDTLSFPYTTGLAYISNIQSKGGWDAVNGLFTEMPASTEQILHPEKSYRGAGRRDPAGRPRDIARDRLDRSAPGHVRRAPDRRSGCASPAVKNADARRPPAGVATGWP